MTFTSGTGCDNSPVSLQLPLGVLAGVVLDELTGVEASPVTGCCLSGLFLVGDIRLCELGSGTNFGVYGGEDSVSFCVPAEAVEDLALSDGLVIVLIISSDCRLTEGLDVEG